MVTQTDLTVTKLSKIFNSSAKSKTKIREARFLLNELVEFHKNDTKRQMESLKMKVEEFELVKRMLR